MHADAGGMDANSIDLSRRRVKVVRDYIVERNYRPTLVQTSGATDRHPAAARANPEGHFRHFPSASGTRLKSSIRSRFSWPSPLSRALAVVQCFTENANPRETNERAHGCTSRENFVR